MQQEFERIICHDISKIMGAVLEAKDPYVSRHSSRVGEMAYKFGKILGLNKEELETVCMAGYLHDIGKIGIQDGILNKQGKLDKRQWEVMKKHSEIGCKILSSSKCFNKISYIVLHNHERWDGKGYPDGLKGEEIPFMSRIISVCDSIDAMRSNRSYGTIMSDLECKEELIRNKEIMYEAKIVECIIENWHDIVTKV